MRRSWRLSRFPPRATTRPIPGSIRRARCHGSSLTATQSATCRRRSFRSPPWPTRRSTPCRARRVVNEDTTLAIAGVSVADVDSPTLTTTLTVASGTLNVTAGAGVEQQRHRQRDHHRHGRGDQRGARRPLLHRQSQLQRPRHAHGHDRRRHARTGHRHGRDHGQSGERRAGGAGRQRQRRRGHARSTARWSRPTSTARR